MNQNIVATNMEVFEDHGKQIKLIWENIKGQSVDPSQSPKKSRSTVGPAYEVGVNGKKLNSLNPQPLEGMRKSLSKNDIIPKGFSKIK